MLINSGLITREQMNSGQNYRVKFSYGTFSITAKIVPSGRYYYAYKRARGKLFKAYVGVCGSITHTKLHQATMKVFNKVYGHTGIFPS